MSLSSAPAPVTTPAGAPLPLVALPQVELLTVNSKELVHTFVTPQSDTEDTVILVRVVRAKSTSPPTASSTPSSTRRCSMSATAKPG